MITENQKNEESIENLEKLKQNLDNKYNQVNQLVDDKEEQKKDLNQFKIDTEQTNEEILQKIQTQSKTNSRK